MTTFNDQTHYVFIDVSGSSLYDMEGWNRRLVAAREALDEGDTLLAFSDCVKPFNVSNIHEMSGGTNVNVIEEFLQTEGYPERITVIMDDCGYPCTVPIQFRDRWNIKTVI